MGGHPTRGTTYEFVLRGELGDRFGFLFEGMHLERLGGDTVLTGTVTDQSHLQGLIQQTQELGLELVSVRQVDEQDRRGQRGASAGGDLNAARETKPSSV